MRFVIDFIRSTPVLVQLYFLYYVLPVYGIKLPALVVGVAALSLYYSGYLAEVFKAGIDGIARASSRRAKALGLTRAAGRAAGHRAADAAQHRGADGQLLHLASSNRRPISPSSPCLNPSARRSTSPPTPSATPSRWLVVGAIFLAIALTLSFLVRQLEAHLALSASADAIVPNRGPRPWTPAFLDQLTPGAAISTPIPNCPNTSTARPPSCRRS